MQQKFFQTADAEVSLSDSGCRSFSIRQQTQDTLFETEDAGVSIRQPMHDIFNQTADARLFLSRGGCMSHSIRQQMQTSLYQTADTGLYLKNSGCRTLSTRQRIQESLFIYQTAVARKPITGADFFVVNNIFTQKYTELTCLLYLELRSIH